MEKSYNKYYLRTYGCQMNKYDSEIVRKILNDNNFHEVFEPEDADIILLNTCAVRENAEKRVIGRLNSLLGIKNKNGNKMIGVLGCMVNSIPELIEHPAVDFIAPPDSYRNIVQWIENSNKGKIPETKEEKYSDIYIESFRTSNYLTITRGCNYFCSYCIVPYTRGSIRSRIPEDIISEAESLVKKGTGELTLLGQNINAYNYRNLKFPDLLQNVANIKGVKRLNFLTSHPMNVPDNLFNVMSDNINITNYLHLPLQSGSDRILNMMKRHYTINDYIKLIEKARKMLPNLTLTTDIIVGFPGESEEDFHETISAVRKIKFDRAFMFAYSDRPGTMSSHLKAKINDHKKKERLDLLIETQNKITEEKIKELVSKEMEVLIIGDSKKGGNLGRTKCGKLITVNGVAKNGIEYIVKINRIEGWVPMGVIKKEV